MGCDNKLLPGVDDHMSFRFSDKYTFYKEDTQCMTVSSMLIFSCIYNE